MPLCAAFYENVLKNWRKIKQATFSKVAQVIYIAMYTETQNKGSYRASLINRNYPSDGNST